MCRLSRYTCVLCPSRPASPARTLHVSSAGSRQQSLNYGGVYRPARGYAVAAVGRGGLLFQCLLQVSKPCQTPRPPLPFGCAETSDSGAQCGKQASAGKELARRNKDVQTRWDCAVISARCTHKQSTTTWLRIQRRRGKQPTNFVLQVRFQVCSVLMSLTAGYARILLGRLKLETRTGMHAPKNMTHHNALAGAEVIVHTSCITRTMHMQTASCAQPNTRSPLLSY